MTRGFDAIVIGGGFYGCSVALALKERLGRVAVFERDPNLLMRASYKNQARVHAGYHYPRSLLTAIRSAANYSRFKEEFSDCLDARCTHLYAIARNLSKVSGYQFQRFCDQVGIVLRPVPREIARLFNPDLVEAVFGVEEAVFDAARLRKRLIANLARAGVCVECGRRVEQIRPASGKVRLHFGDSETASAPYVFNCTYSDINHVLAASNLRTLPLKHEVAELALIDAPRPLQRVAVTVMDGPFFSVVPFPSLGCHTLSHVTYTPHSSWTVRTRRQAPSEPASKSIFMLRDAQRYLPILSQARGRGSLFETKTVLLRNEADDGRPILYYRHTDAPGLVSILGSKIDNIYDVVRALQSELFRTELACESSH